MASDGDAPAPLTAAEKRAARRAKVLAGGERRLKLLTGEIGSLKRADEEEETEEDAAVARAMDAGVAELLDATELPAVVAVEQKETSEPADGGAKFPPRVDPAQRRRDAQARRQKKEAMVQEILAGGSSASATAAAAPTAVSAEDVYADTVTTVRQELGGSADAAAKKGAEPAFSRHALALRLRSAEEKLILLAIVGAALYLGAFSGGSVDLWNACVRANDAMIRAAFATDLRNITTDLLMSNPLYLSYKQLVANGVSLEAIRQQMQRENLEPTLMDQIERVFVSQRKSDSDSAASASIVRSLVPNFGDLPGFFASWLYQPPIILCVLLLRVLVGLIGGALHTALKLPDVANPQDDDMGFVANLALSSRPVLKSYIAKARKSVDDVFLFLWSFVLAVAARAVATAHVV